MAHNTQQPAAQPAAQPSPQQMAMAKLQAAMAAQGASNGACINLAKLQPGQAYTLRQVAQAMGYIMPKRPNGKPNKAPLRRALQQAVASGKLVTATTGGYTTVNGTTAGGKAFYMLVD